MTILEAIVQADRTRRNEIPPELKLQWLSALDGQLHRELILAHGATPDRGLVPGQPSCPGLGPELPGLPGGTGQGPEAFQGYGPETDVAAVELLAPYPYDSLYPAYLVMRVDLEQGELERYNNDAALFNRLWQSFAGNYVHTHSPRGVTALRF